MFYLHDKFYTPKSDGSCVQVWGGGTNIFPVHLQTNILKSYIKRVPYSSDFNAHMLAIYTLYYPTNAQYKICRYN